MSIEELEDDFITMYRWYMESDARQIVGNRVVGITDEDI